MKDEVTLPDYEVGETLLTLSQKIDWSLSQMNVPLAWKESRGEGIMIAVLDTGHPNHQDLQNNVQFGTSTTGERTTHDVNGHQTHCTGIISADDNNMGTVGVAHKASVISVKVLTDSGSGSWQSVADGLDYCLKIRPNIVSMSLGGNAPNKLIEDKIKELYAVNIPVICAAGNSGSGGVNWPAAYDETIAVAAFDKDGKVASFSSKGEKVEWAAPGVNIYSTYTNNSYASLSGTSMACPFMVGIVALMLSKHKKQEKETGKNDCTTVEEIREHLLKYTMDKGRLGKDNSWGYGVIDIKSMFGGSSTSSSKSSSSNSSSSNSRSSTSSTSSKTPLPDPIEEESTGLGVLAWGIFGLFIAVAITMFGISKCTEDDFEIPEPPEYPEQGYWDEKFQDELDNK